MTNLYEEEWSLRKGVFLFRTLDDCQEMIDYARTARRAYPQRTV